MTSLPPSVAIPPPGSASDSRSMSPLYASNTFFNVGSRKIPLNRDVAKLAVNVRKKLPG